MIEKRLYAKEVSELLGVNYRKALTMLKGEIPSFIDTIACGEKPRVYRYTYQSLVSQYQLDQINSIKPKEKISFNMKRKGLDDRTIDELFKSFTKEGSDISRQ